MNFLMPSPPAEQNTSRQDQARKSSTGDGAGDGYGAKRTVDLAVDPIVE
jgi:hypothetical protein